MRKIEKEEVRLLLQTVHNIRVSINPGRISELDLRNGLWDTRATLDYFFTQELEPVMLEIVLFRSKLLMMILSKRYITSVLLTLSLGKYKKTGTKLGLDKTRVLFQEDDTSQ